MTQQRLDGDTGRAGQGRGSTRRRSREDRRSPGQSLSDLGLEKKGLDEANENAYR